MGKSLSGSAALLVLLVACSSSAQPQRQQLPTDVVATIGDLKVTLAEVDDRALKQSADAFAGMTLSQALYEARRGALEEIVGSSLIDREAKALGLEPFMLTKGEIASKVTPPSDDDVNAWYQTNQARVQGASIDQVREPIRQLLTQERTRDARLKYLDTLKAKTSVRLMLEPPRVAVGAAGRPVRGNASAPIEIIEFSDFECPFCQRATPTVMQVLSTYGDRVRLVYRHYPLSNHPNARPAAEASACAAAQDKFWPYHDRLFESPNKLGADDLKRHAAELGLDAAKFNACVDARTFQEQVDADIAAANEAGISGTPLFLVNGRPLEGAQPFAAFQRVIDEELARQGK
jgi:protein-disulfide isomerase